MIAIDTRVNLAIPVAYALMQTKDPIQYEAIFSELKKQFNAVKVKLSPDLIICDFESGLHAAIKKAFSSVKIRGCYFHFIKSWWSKAQSLGLKTKNRIKETKDIIMKLKIMVHLPKENRQEYFKIIQDLYKSDSLISEFLTYIKQYYLDSRPGSFQEYLEYTDEFEVEKQFIRTNNILEGERQKPQDFLSFYETKDLIVLESISVLNKLTEEYKKKFGLKYIKELAKSGFSTPDYFDIEFEKHQKWLDNSELIAKRKYEEM